MYIRQLSYLLMYQGISVYQFVIFRFKFQVLFSQVTYPKESIMDQPVSLKAQLTQIALSQLGQKDETEEKLGSAVLGNVVTMSTVNTANASAQLSVRLVESLAQLQALGYDKDSDVAKSLIANNNAISQTLNKVSDSMSKLV